MANFNITLSFEGVGLDRVVFEKETGLAIDKYDIATVYHPPGYAWAYIEIDMKSDSMGVVLDSLLSRLNNCIEPTMIYLSNNNNIQSYLSVYCENKEGESGAQIRFSNEHLQILASLGSQLSIQIVYV
jgi:hypothetical protein